MKKSFCDKCGKDCTYQEREFKCNNGASYIWVDDSSGNEIAKDLLLCLDCKGLFEKLVKDFLTSNQK